MIIQTFLGVDVHTTEKGETYEFYHIPPVNNMTVGIAYSVNDGTLLPYDYENESLWEKEGDSVLGEGKIQNVLLDTDTGEATFYDFHGVEQQRLTVLPNALTLIRDNFKADPTGLDEWGGTIKSDILSVAHLER